MNLSRRESYKKLLCMLSMLLVLCVILLQGETKVISASTKSKASYTITTKTNPLNEKYKKYDTYNKNTKHYYVLRSYLEALETSGGGTLTLSKGTYTVTNTLYIPSNVTIILKNGATIKKSNTTGTTKLTGTKTLFQTVAPSNSTKNNSSVKYTGVKNIVIKGSGTATIDLGSVKDTTGLAIGHASNVTIQGINFKNMNDGSFIKASAVNKLTIIKNTFIGHKKTTLGIKEAINIETPDDTTAAFPYPWSKGDKTASKSIIIKSNTFSNLERAIGSTKYTENVYQKNISITDNKFSDISNAAVRGLNWEDTTIKSNTFDAITNKEGSARVLFLSGMINPTIKENTMKNSDRPIQIMPAKNNNNGSKYKPTYNTISDDNKVDMLNNVLINMKEHYIRYNTVLDEFEKGTEKWDIIDYSENTFTLTPSSTPYNNAFTNYSTYNEHTRMYYVLRSYLEQLEATKGGTITLTKGTYGITNTLYVPSNVTIKLLDGAKLLKTSLPGDSELGESRSLFHLAAPANSKTAGYYKGYLGESNIHFIGEGNAVIDLDYMSDSLGIILGHNSNVSIKGITFIHMNSGHFIEVDASKDVVIKNNKFMDAKATPKANKEAINVDTPDKLTQGFNVIWTSHDKTPNKDIIIQNNIFENLEVAIGTHKYSEGKYHDNIQIINNKMTNMVSDPINIMNWSNPVIKGNVIDTVKTEGNRAILMAGVKNPTVMDNTFKNVSRPIQLRPWKNSDTGEEYAITYNEITTKNIEDMLKNTLINVGETFIRVNKTYNVADRDTDKYQYSVEYIK